ncbi:serine hydrolase domain-containing protein [Xanthobacter tagetidis]|jgi:CubicO group peptidase (beta-lactamase class C family)|uniref:Class A beta-lactamase-related serine hydrolase n=1 Tax=Xanthobacter tagetidis TaxID=60216 RepID=A0A3L6ZV39_9HYPH|nr:serine hydrolase domain-containing protein [Xanthobacter tagetidis]MBB6308656.1 CubicO group peptidase (beta-lactamase class C family) [Xanthobacter tagetidis]RLP71535.1 class A beta-lactamase-related serine hydrolase [Xanthobacter tagetidis]
MHRSLLLPAALALSLVSAVPAFARSPAEELGFSTKALERIKAAMAREIDKGTMPGAVTLIARDGEIVHFEAYGFLDAAKTKPMPKDAVFRAFSMTKPFVAVAAMMLVERGQLSLRDPVATYIPEMKAMTVLAEKTDASGKITREAVPATRTMTVHDLLRHTTGLTYSVSAPFPELKDAYLKADLESRDGDLSPEEFVKRLAATPLAYEPGTRFEYGLSVDVLGIVVERVSGKRLDVFLEDELFKPLGMKDTHFQLTPDQTARLADALDTDPQKVDGWKWVRVDQDPGKRYRLGGAGTVTTAQDYFRFAQMMLNGGELDGVRILSPRTVDFMLSDHTLGLGGSTAGTTGPGYGFGLGFGIRRQEGMAVVPGSPGDAMWAGAGGTSFTIDPKEDLVGVFMAAAPTPRVHTRMLFKNLMYGAMTE